MKLNELVKDPHSNQEKEAEKPDTDWDAWDEQIQADLDAGRLQPVIDEALAQEGSPL